MKSTCDLLKRKPSIENSGDNYGVEAASNSGLIVVNQGMGYDNTKALCLDVVSDELNKYKAEAYEEAKRRDSDLFEKVVAELSKRNMTDEQMAGSIPKAGSNSTPQTNSKQFPKLSIFFQKKVSIRWKNWMQPCPLSMTR